MITGLITAGIALATEIFKYLNTEESRKYIDKMVELQLGIQKEEEKGYKSDDAKIESMHKELIIIMEAAKNELALLQANSSSK